MIAEKLAFDGVIFDLDGTLVDTLEDIADAMNRVLARRGLPGHRYDAYRAMVGHGLRRLVADALPPERRTEEMVAACYDEMIAEYGEHCLAKTRLYHGVAELLAGLRSARVPLGVLSNKADHLARRIVAALTEPGTFVAVMGARPDLPAKPDPRGAEQLGTRLAPAPARIAFVGDSGVDMTTATRAGMLAIGVSWGFRSRDELLDGGARVVIDHPLDLLRLRASS